MTLRNWCSGAAHIFSFKLVPGKPPLPKKAAQAQEAENSPTPSPCSSSLQETPNSLSDKRFALPTSLRAKYAQSHRWQTHRWREQLDPPAGQLQSNKMHDLQNVKPKKPPSELGTAKDAVDVCSFEHGPENIRRVKVFICQQSTEARTFLAPRVSILHKTRRVMRPRNQWYHWYFTIVLESCLH